MANPNILIDAHPHIGTDKLPQVIVNMRKTIEKYGGEVRFNSRVRDIIIEQNRVKGVVTGDQEIQAEHVILATGHSARDVYRMLQARSVLMQPKDFAVGLRLEHPQELIDRIQYHNPQGRGDFLPAAEYSFVTNMDEMCIRDRYMGTPDFAVYPLQKLLEAGHKVVAVVTNPDKPAGRGQKIQESPVKKFAVEKGIPVLQPERFRDERFLEELRAFQADLQLVVAFKMLPEVVWNIDVYKRQAEWSVDLKREGRYEVFAYLPEYTYSQVLTKNRNQDVISLPFTYIVSSANGEEEVTIQAKQKHEWVSLGV